MKGVRVMAKTNKKKKTRQNSNYQNPLKQKLPVVEEFNSNPMWDVWQLGLINDKQSFYNALKNGEYIVGFDLSLHGGVIYQNVIHYQNGAIEVFKFIPNALANIPCKLLKDARIRISKDIFELIVDVLIWERYDGFLVSHNGAFLNVKNVLGEYKDCYRIMQPPQLMGA